MKKLSAIIPMMMIAASPVFAQHINLFIKRPQFHAPYKLSDPVKYQEWDNNPVLHPVPPEYGNQPALLVKRDISIDYRYEGKGVSAFITEHYIIKVLNEEGIEAFNKQRIEVPTGTRIPLIKARTIAADGKVYELRKEMMKTTAGYTGHAVALVMEKVSRNAEIELLIKRIVPGADYNKEYFQFELPVLSSRFELSYPKEMVFEMKSHGGFPQMKDTVVGRRKNFVVELNDIKPQEKEGYSMPDLHRVGLEYRFKNFASNTERAKLNTWDDYARKLWNDNYKISEKEKAAVNRFLSELRVKENVKEEDRIKAIEDGIKSRITSYELVDYDLRREVLASRDFRSVSVLSSYYDDRKEPLDSIIINRVATPQGFVKLFAACLTQADVRHEIGTVGDRREYTFYRNFENWDGMTHTLIYFPNQKKYLDPETPQLRYPVVPAEFTGGKGVFCTITPGNKVHGSLYALRTVTPLPYNESALKMTASVSFDRNMDAHIDMAWSRTGYNSIDMRTRLNHMHRDKIKDMVRESIPFVERNAEIEKYSFSNESFEHYHTNKPLELYASVNTASLTEHAGQNYIFDLGDMVPQHPELYSEKDRVMPVDMNYPGGRSYTISINIPKGYKVLNADDVRMSADYQDQDQNTVLSFTSDYALVKDRVNGDKLIVTVKEYNTNVHFAMSEYEAFRKVMNTAADFNKVKLVIGRRPL